MSTRSSKGFLLGYMSTLQNLDARKRYQEKLDIIGGLDPYETDRIEWRDDIDMWPSITRVHIGMFLLVMPSTYTGEELVNYKSVDCYIKFLVGWVR